MSSVAENLSLPGSTTPRGQSRPVVLVADDDADIRLLMCRQLEYAGYAVLEAADGRTALASAQQVHLDLALVDIEMPYVDGYQLLDRLKADPRSASVPVVLVTARTLAADVVKGLGLGAHDYLRKPFESSELLARVDAALKINQLQDELRRRNEDLELAVRTDPLTRLWNRRHLDETLRTFADELHRRHQPLAVIAIDVDRFKSINDLHGHAAGDTVLCEVAGRLRAIVRQGDVVGRWGGEEFLALLPAAVLPDALALAERLRTTIATSGVRMSAKAVIDVTVSVGVAAGPAEASEVLVHDADRALYAAKAAGRNTVCAAT